MTKDDFGQFERELPGFIGGISIADLQQSLDTFPVEQGIRGIYLIVRDSGQPVKFLDMSKGGHFKGKNPTVSKIKLERKWLDHAKILYIGKAGGTDENTTLRGRLRSYMLFGLGKPFAHWGGRYIWQLTDAHELKVYWKSTEQHVVPVDLERELLSRFKRHYGKLPFANLRL